VELGLITGAVGALGGARGLLAVKYLDATLREALPTSLQSWPGIFARVLARVRGPRAPRRPRWYDSDAAHRGF
jgi:hypothetical protein